VRSLAAIALGSNLESSFGDREANLGEAIRLIRSLGEVTAVSSFYETEPVGFLAQPWFLNGALLLATDLEPLVLLWELLAVERAMGRERVGAVAKGPRVIDLDLLLYFRRDGFKRDGFNDVERDAIDQDRGDVVMETKELVLPHPEMQMRRFVLEPLAEIAPDMVHPVLELTVRELLTRL
jgi:2-amino-4-hydroxy-6-hydroxymethyldihydropteridine diphosphokinase